MRPIDEDADIIAECNNLQILMELLASCYGVKIAAILRQKNHRVEILTSVGLFADVIPSELHMPAFLEPGDLTCPDASIDSGYSGHPLVTGIWGLRFVVVRRLWCKNSADPYFIFLADDKARYPDNLPDLSDLDEISQLVCRMTRISRIVNKVQALSPDINVDAGTLASLFDDEIFPVLAVSSDLKVHSVNVAAHPFIVLPPEGVGGKELKDIFPVHHKAFEKIGRALFSGETKTGQSIDIEFDIGKTEKRFVYLQILIVPLINSQGHVSMIIATACDVTVARVLAQKFSSDPRDSSRGFQEHNEIQKGSSNPVIQFLLDTLVEQRALRSRNNVSYLTVRTWRKAIKAYQIKALKALKSTAPEQCAEAIGDEILAVLAAMAGTSSFDGIVPIPCGHSKKEECLSTMIADIIAGKTGIPVFRAFVPRPLEGSSHPKASARMPPLKLRQEAKGNYLLVDDVVTSGRHIEEAVEILRREGADVMAIAWIGGEKA